MSCSATGALNDRKEKMRTFIAINFDRRVIERLTDLRAALKMYATGGRFTDPENLHLTLAFLGEVGQNRTGRLDEILRSLSGLAAPVLTFDGIGSFGRGLYFARIKPTPELMTLQSELTRRLIGAGFAPDERDFRPHVTLARGLEVSGKPEISYEPFSMRAGRISLMKSELLRGGPRYSEIISVTLGNN